MLFLRTLWGRLFFVLCCLQALRKSSDESNRSAHDMRKIVFLSGFFQNFAASLQRLRGVAEMFQSFIRLRRWIGGPYRSAPGVGRDPAGRTRRRPGGGNRSPKSKASVVRRDPKDAASGLQRCKQGGEGTGPVCVRAQRPKRRLKSESRRLKNERMRSIKVISRTRSPHTSHRPSLSASVCPAGGI